MTALRLVHSRPQRARLTAAELAQLDAIVGKARCEDCLARVKAAPRGVALWATAALAWALTWWAGRGR